MRHSSFPIQRFWINRDEGSVDWRIGMRMKHYVLQVFSRRELCVKETKTSTRDGLDA